MLQPSQNEITLKPSHEFNGKIKKGSQYFSTGKLRESNVSYYFVPLQDSSGSHIFSEISKIFCYYFMYILCLFYRQVLSYTFYSVHCFHFLSFIHVFALVNFQVYPLFVVDNCPEIYCILEVMNILSLKSLCFVLKLPSSLPFL